MRRLCTEQVDKVAALGWRVLPDIEGAQIVCLLYSFMPVLSTDREMLNYEVDARRVLGLTRQEVHILERGFEGWSEHLDDGGLYQVGQRMAEYCRQKFIGGGAA